MSIRALSSLVADAAPIWPWQQADLQCQDITLHVKFSATSPLSPIKHFVFDVQRGGQSIGECNLTIGDDSETQYFGNIGSHFSDHFYGSQAGIELLKHLFGLAKRAGSTRLLLTFPPGSRLMERFCLLLGGVHLDTIPLPGPSSLSTRGSRTEQQSVCRYQVIL